MDLVDVDDDDRPEAGLPPLDVPDGERAEVEPVHKVARWQNLIAPPRPPPGAIQGKEGIKFCSAA